MPKTQTTARAAAEHRAIANRYRPSARELFPALRARLLASRPVLAVTDEGTPRERVVLGKPTFRNVIEDGEWK